MKRVAYLAALLAMIILVPSALAQDVLPGDDDPMTPEPDVVEVAREELAQIAGQPPPSEDPISEPLPKSGGPEIGGPALLMILPAAAALLLGLGVLAYSVLRKAAGERG